ncbi:MAG TPA: hypothetical protein PKV38_12515, partial [bacterium]|nr:hypothetical protein [bacterium]
MEANSSQNPNQSAAPNQKATPPAPKPPERVVIRMWPKTPVLYPMAILALICSLVGAMAGSSPK